MVWHSRPYAYDLNGKELWHRDLGEQRHIWGYGSSPIIEGNICFLEFGPGKRSFVIAVDKRTGKTLWQHDESTGDSGENKPDGAKAVWIGAWNTPIIADGSLIVALPSRVLAFDPATGKEHWSCRGLNPLVYTLRFTQTGSLLPWAVTAAPLSLLKQEGRATLLKRIVSGRCPGTNNASVRG